MNIKKYLLKKRFLCSVSYNIKCCKKDKKEYLDFLSVSIDDFLSENENICYQQIISAFGTPKKLALEFSKDLPAKAIKTYRLKKRLLLSIICIVLLAPIVLYFAVLIYENCFNIGYFVQTYSGSSPPRYVDSRLV